MWSLIEIFMIHLCCRQSPQIAPTQYQQESSIPNIHVDRLVNKVLEVQDIRQKIHMLQEELNWDKQNYETLQGSHSSVFL